MIAHVVGLAGRLFGTQADGSLPFSYPPRHERPDRLGLRRSGGRRPRRAAAVSRRAVALRLRLDSEIEARCAAEQGHAECERRFETVFESLPECMKLHDEAGLIRTMNPVGLAMVDADSPTQVVGESVYRFIAPEYQDRYRALTAAVFRGEACSMEFRLLGLKGSERSIETHVVPARDHRGQVIAAMALRRDVTKVHDAEDRARRHLSELARMARIASMGEMASGIG